MRWILMGLALAAGRAQAAPLDWEACVAETLARNADLKQAKENAFQARLEHAKALAQFLPRASASASVSRGGDYEPLDGPFEFGPGRNPSYSLGLSVSQSLFSGFSSLAALSSAKATLETAEQNARDTKARVAFELRSAFAGLLFSQDQIQVNDEIARRRKENVALVELRYEAGREHKGSFLESRAQSLQADFDAAKARRDKVDASFTLARVMGRDLDAALEVAGTFSPAAPPAEPDYKKEAAELPGPRRAKAAWEQAKAGLTQATANLLPDLNASAGLSRSGGDWAPNNGSWSASLSLSVPLFSGLSDFNSRRQSSSRLRSAEAELDDALRQAMLDLRQSWSSFTDAYELSGVRKEFLEAAESRSEIARAQYTQGLLSFLNWDQIESNLISSRRAALASLRDAALAEASWQRALGKGLEP